MSALPEVVSGADYKEGIIYELALLRSFLYNYFGVMAVGTSSIFGDV